MTREPNNYPRFLYKYLSENTPIEHLRCLLIDSDFYLSSCTDFNDPFDTTAQIIHGGNVVERRKRFTEIVKKRLPTIKKAELNKTVSTMMATYANKPEALDKIFDVNTQNSGIFSLTANPRNILMWSHYASDHKGLIVQFDIAKDPESLLYSLPMHYSEDYPSYNINEDMSTKFESIVLRKAIDWLYEKEWRLLRVGGAHTYLPFKPQALPGLIYGCRISDTFKKEIIELLHERRALKHPPVKTYKAIKHKSKYALQIFKDN